MRSYGENVSEEKIVQKILMSLSKNFKQIVTVIEETKDITKLSVTVLMGSLEAFEKREEDEDEDEDSVVESEFQSKLNMKSQNSKNDWENPNENSRGRESTRNNGNPKRERSAEEKSTVSTMWHLQEVYSHLENDCWFQNKPQCRNCKKFEHVEKFCRLKRNHQAKFSEDHEDESSVTYYASQPGSSEEWSKW